MTNLAGHKLPTAYPSRRAWLQVTVIDAAGTTLFESGTFQADGSVAGNDNDEDPLRFEPHHRTIDAPDQVQVYESVMSDPEGQPTTGLLTAVGFAKDNRLTPDGFDRAAGGPDVAVLGGAADDPDFAAGTDRVRYSVDVAGTTGPHTVEVRLWYQPIGFRWARNLEEYDAPEPARFVRWYDEMAAGSAIVLASASISVSP